MLKQQLQSIEELSLIDYDLGQYSQAGEDHVRATPVCYIGFSPIEWETLPKRLQVADLEFTVTLVSLSAYGDDRDITDTEYINHLAIEDKIYKALHGQHFLLSSLNGNANLAGTDEDRVILNSIVRTNSNPHSQLNNLVSTSQTFISRSFDYSAVAQMTEVMAQIDCNIQNQ